MNPIKSDHLRKELAYMLENGIVKSSDSDWSFPSLLVSGTFRFCTDYHKVNSITKNDLSLAQDR